MMMMMMMMVMTVISYSAMSGLDVRRKNATRESTSTLKAWLFQHIKNPYPTKGEKIMLAIVTRMTLTQVKLHCYYYYGHPAGQAIIFCSCGFFEYTSFGWGKGWNVTSAGWQITL